jgi:hypothetical protein
MAGEEVVHEAMLQAPELIESDLFLFYRHM